MPPFVPGLELSRRLFTEHVRPILAEAHPGLRFAAALVGYGSEVLGFDSERSTDHAWGPRMQLFLPEEDRALLVPVRARLAARPEPRPPWAGGRTRSSPRATGSPSRRSSCCRSPPAPSTSTAPGS